MKPTLAAERALSISLAKQSTAEVPDGSWAAFAAIGEQAEAEQAAEAAAEAAERLSSSSGTASGLAGFAGMDVFGTNSWWPGGGPTARSEAEPEPTPPMVAPEAPQTGDDGLTMSSRSM